MKVSVFFLLIFFNITLLYSQKISGTVVDGRNDAVVSNVKISDEATGLWTISDAKGQFAIVSEKGAKLTFSKSGWIDESISINESSSNNIVVRIFPATIRIPEVQLTAKKNNFSSIEIKEEALQKNQSFSLGDVLQQLPGQYVQPLNNTEMKNIVLRSANVSSMSSGDMGSQLSAYSDDFGNKAFGTQIMIKDIVLSNNSNMQSYNSATSNPFTEGFTIDGSRGNVIWYRP
jgi:hypothetical protein